MADGLASLWSAITPEPAMDAPAPPIDDPSLSRGDRQFLTQLRRVMQRPMDSSPGDFGLDRLQRDIERLQREGRRNGWLARIERWLMRATGI